MKTITLWQPWASLIATGAKKIETRSWPTKYRGLLAIHASASAPSWVKKLRFIEPYRSVLYKHNLLLSADKWPFGKVVATCNLVDCVEITNQFIDGLTEQEKAFGDYTPGRYAWILEDVKKLDPPVPAKGKQGLWNWEGRGL